ncbi:hypothetical protein T484DRAFT_1898756, partial [Baffinella frigidus]
MREGGIVVREEGPSHRTLWSEDSPGDVIEGLRGVIADGLVKEREALLQDRAAVDEAHIARLRRAAAAAVEAELAAKSENVQLKAELAQAYQALANRRMAAAVEGQERTRSENEQLRSSYQTLSQKYEEQGASLEALAAQQKEQLAAHQAATERLAEKASAFTALSERLDAKTSSYATLAAKLHEKTSSFTALSERLAEKTSSYTTLSDNFDQQTVNFDKQTARLDLDLVVPRLLRFATRRPATSHLEKCWTHWTGLARKGIFYSVRAASIQNKLAWKRAMVSMLRISSDAPSMTLRASILAWHHFTTAADTRRAFAGLQRYCAAERRVRRIGERLKVRGAAVLGRSTLAAWHSGDGEAGCRAAGWDGTECFRRVAG